MDSVNVRATVEVRSFTHSWDNSANVKTWVTPWIRPSRSPKVNDFGTNRKRVYEFLLIGNSNLGRISHRFGDIAAFLPCRVTPTLFNPNFGGVPVAPDSPCWVSPRAKALGYSAEKLFSTNSDLCDHHTWTSHTDRQTDGQTDRQTTYDSNTALCVASRGKKKFKKTNWAEPSRYTAGPEVSIR